jgi:hypothetical protein
MKASLDSHNKGKPGEALLKKLIAEARAERRVEEARRGALEAFAKLRGEGGEDEGARS